MESGMPNTTLLKALWQVFYSKSLYLEVYRGWSYRIFTFLALLALLTSLTALIKPFGWIENFRADSDRIFAQLPSIRIYNHVMSIDKASPYVIRLSDQSRNLIVFDTNADVQKLHSYQPLLFTFGATGFMFHNLNTPEGQQAFHFKPYADYTSALNNLSLTPKQSIQCLSIFIALLQLGSYLITVGITFFEYLGSAVCFGLVMLALAVVHRVKLTKSGAFRLGALASTPAALLAFIYALLPLGEHSWPSLVGIAISFCYSVFAVRSIQKGCVVP